MVIMIPGGSEEHPALSGRASGCCDSGCSVCEAAEHQCWGGVGLSWAKSVFGSVVE